MKHLHIILLLLSLAISNTSNATDYFYCDCQAGASDQCVTGNNSNNGTSPSSPKQTFSSANSQFGSLVAGDSLNFCRGGSFSTNVQNTWVNNNCTSDNVCTVTAYDLPGNESPQLASPIITQQTNSTLFSLVDGGAADHEEGYTFSDLDLRCTGCASSGTGYGFFFYNDIDFVTIKDISLNGFRIGVHLSTGNTPNPGSDGKNSDIILNNLKIVNSKSQGILGGADNLQISNSYFENNGNGTMLDHNVYISKGNGILFNNNELYRSSLDASGNCAGAPLVVHGIISNFVIENNIIREDIGKAGPGCWGIAVDPGYASAESFNNITIRNNKVINVGNIGIGLTSCDTCTIENNVILHQQAFGATAISAPDSGRGADDLALNKVTIRNNSIYTSSPSGVGIVLGTEGSGHSIVSNAVHYVGTGKFTCFNFGLPASAYTNIDNNTCYFPNALSSSEWEAGSGTNPNPLAAWQGQSGFGANSQNVNPGFNNPTIPAIDFSPQNNSSAIVNKGHSTSSPKDYRGKTRDSQPDAGAFEFGTYNPPAKTKIYTN